MPRTPKRTPTEAQQDKYSETEIARRRDDAIRRALRTPPTHLKDIPKKRPVKGASSKRGGS
jgi:hypothetical protein